MPDFEKTFEVHTDASDRAIGGVLVQEGHPIAFDRKLSDAERNYSTHEKEMTTVVHCLGIWRVYLVGPKFVVKTNNVLQDTKEIVATTSSVAGILGRI